MATKSNDTSLKELLDDVGNGKIQLPEFQRPGKVISGRDSAETVKEFGQALR